MSSINVGVLRRQNNGIHLESKTAFRQRTVFLCVPIGSVQSIRLSLYTAHSHGSYACIYLFLRSSVSRFLFCSCRKLFALCWRALGIFLHAHLPFRIFRLHHSVPVFVSARVCVFVHVRARSCICPMLVSVCSIAAFAKRFRSQISKRKMISNTTNIDICMHCIHTKTYGQMFERMININWNAFFRCAICFMIAEASAHTHTCAHSVGLGRSFCVDLNATRLWDVISILNVLFECASGPLALALAAILSLDAAVARTKTGGGDWCEKSTFMPSVSIKTALSSVGIIDVARFLLINHHPRRFEALSRNSHFSNMHFTLFFQLQIFSESHCALHAPVLDWIILAVVCSLLASLRLLSLVQSLFY